MWPLKQRSSTVLMLGRNLPSWRVEITGDQARFVVGVSARELIRAERDGDRLNWHELPELERRCHRALRGRAAMTFAIALATRGWPLKQTTDSEVNHGLAAASLGIQLGEAWYRSNEWPVRTPEIPGLEPITLFML